MRKHQLKLANHQCCMAELSHRIQLAVVILCTSLYAGSDNSPVVQKSGDVLATSLTNELLGRRPTDKHLRVLTDPGATIAEHGFPGLESIKPDPIMMPYKLI